METIVLIPYEVVAPAIKSSQLAEHRSGQSSATMIGMRHLRIDSSWWDAKRLVVGEIVGITKHHDADRLVIVTINYGEPASEQVVTSAPNIYGMLGDPTFGTKVAFARVGAELVNPHSEEVPRSRKKLKSSNVRGVRSHGMVCSEREVGVSEEHDSVPILPSDAKPGMALGTYLGQDVLRVRFNNDVGSKFSCDEWVRYLTIAPNMASN